MAAIEQEKGHGNIGVVPWTGFVDPNEDEPPVLQWPASIKTYRWILTDAQVKGLVRGVTLPIQHFNWHVDPNGARDEVAEFCADDLGLPIKGQEPKPRPRHRGRFSWSDHLAHALLKQWYGHMVFEQVYRIDENGKAHIKKWAPRMPATISSFVVERDGGLKAIKQYSDGRTTIGGPAWIANAEIELPIERLLVYTHDKEGANWIGQSMLRPLYRHVLRKDRLLRVDALKHERNGMGMPTIEMPPGATPADIARANDYASSVMAGERAGGALPAGARLRLVGVEGSLPDTIASIMYDDQQMAKLFLEMFVELGQTATGSRALGESFIDFFAMGLRSVAQDIANVASDHGIEDLVDLNWGEDEPAPRIAFDEPDPDAAVEELAKLVESKLLVVDNETRAWIRTRYNMPAAEDPEAAPEPEPGPDPIVAEPVDAKSPKALAEIVQKIYLGVGTVLSKEEAREILNQAGANLTDEPPEDPPPPPMLLPPGLPVAEPPEGTETPTEAARRRLRRATAATSGRRDLFDHEVAAATDFDALDAEWQSATDKAVETWTKEVRPQQVDDLVGQVQAAIDADDIAALGSLSTEVSGVTVLTEATRSMLAAGAVGAVMEARKQGLDTDVPDLETLAEQMDQRAIATDLVVARGLAEAASKEALVHAGGSLGAEEVASAVREHLDSLGDTFLVDQIGGALTAAQNAGRLQVMEQNEGRLYASELLDGSTCERCGPKDGAEYTSETAARSDYPVGGYRECLGGPRCRGTLVKVYDEAPATVQ